jgi:hypothetical protein
MNVWEWQIVAVTCSIATCQSIAFTDALHISFMCLNVQHASCESERNNWAFSYVVELENDGSSNIDVQELQSNLHLTKVTKLATLTVLKWFLI